MSLIFPFPFSLLCFPHFISFPSSFWAITSYFFARRRPLKNLQAKLHRLHLDRFKVRSTLDIWFDSISTLESSVRFELEKGRFEGISNLRHTSVYHHKVSPASHFGKLHSGKCLAWQQGDSNNDPTLHLPCFFSAREIHFGHK